MKTLKLSKNSSPANYLRSTARSAQKRIRSATGGSGTGRELRRRTSRLLGASTTKTTSGGRRFLNSAALIAAAVGLGYAVKRYAGANLTSLIRGIRGRQRESGFEPGRSYGNVHGTEGARMPEPAEAARTAKRTEPKTVEGS